MKPITLRQWVIAAGSLLALGLWWVDASGMLVDGYRSALQETLRQQTGHPVTIARLTGGLWGRVVAHRLAVADVANWRVQVDRTIVHVRTFQLLRDFSHPERAIRYVALDHPSILYVKPVPIPKGDRAPSTARVEPSAVTGATPSPDVADAVAKLSGRWEIRIRGAEVGALGAAESLKGMHGSLVLEDGVCRWVWRLEGSGVAGSVAQVFGRFDVRRKTCEMEFRAAGFEVAPFTGWMKYVPDVPVERIAGRVKGEVTYRGVWPLVRSGWSGRLAWDGGEVVARRSSAMVEGVRLNGAFSSEAARVSVESGSAFHPVAGNTKFKGRVVWDQDGLRVDGWEMERQQLWLTAYGRHRQDVGGTFDVTLRRKSGLKGPASHPKGSDVVAQFAAFWNPREFKLWTTQPSREMSLDARAALGDTSQFQVTAKGQLLESVGGFSQVSGQGSWNDRAVTISRLEMIQRGQTVGRGRMVLPLTGEQGPEGAVMIDGLDVNALPGLSGSAIPGRLSATIRLGGTRDQPVVQGEAALKGTGAKAGIWKDASVDLEVTRDTAAVRRLSLAGGQMTADAAIRDPWLLKRERAGDGRLRFKNFAGPSVLVKDGEIEWRFDRDRLSLVAGRLETVHGRYRLSGHATWVEVMKGICRIDVDRSWGPDRLTGHHQVAFRVNPSPWSVETTLESALAIRGRPLPLLNAAATIGETAAVVSRASWGSFVEGTARVRWGPKPLVQGSFDFRDCPMDAIGLVAGIRDASKGVVNGTVRLSGIQPFPAGEVLLRVKDGQIGDIRLGACTVGVSKGMGDAYAVEIRAGEGTSQTFSALGTVTWVVPTGPVSQKPTPLAALTKTDLTWTCVNQPMAPWMNLIFGEESAPDVSGTVRGHGRMVGTLKDPTIQGDFNFQHGRILGNAYEVIGGSMVIQREELRIAEAKWQGVEDQVAVRGVHVSWAGGKTHWTCEEVRLDPYRVWAFRLMGGLAITGSAEPLGGWVTKVESRDLSINGYPYGGLAWQIRFNPQRGEFSIVEPGTGAGLTQVTVAFEKEGAALKPSTVRLPKGVINARGRIMSHGVDLVLQGVNAEAAFIVKALDVAIDGEGTTDFELRITKSLAAPRVDGTMKIRDGRFELWPFRELAGKFTIENQWMYLKPWVMSAPGRFTVTANGKVPILLPSKEMSLDIDVDDRRVDTLMPLGWFKSLEGNLKGRLHFAGTPGHPIMSGKLVMDGAIIRPKALFEEIRDAKGTFVIQRGQGVFEGASGTIEGIPIQIKGSIGFKDYDPAKIDVAVSSKGQTVAVNVPGIMAPGTKALVVVGGLSDEWFAIKGPREAPTYQGKVMMQNGKFTWPPRYLGEAGGGGGSTAGAGGGKYEFIKDFYYDVLFEVGDRLFYFNDYVDVPLRRGDQVTYAGLGRRINITGTINADAGTFRYLDHNFKILSGKGLWVGEGTKVYATAKAETQYQGYRFTAVVRGKDQEMGTLEELIVVLSSDPPLTQQQIASILTVGVDTTQMTEQQVGEKFQEQLGQLLVSQGLAMGTRNAMRNVRELIGLDELSFRPTVEGRRVPQSFQDAQGGLFANWEVGIGKYLTTGFFVGTNIKRGSLEGIPYWRQELQLNYSLLGGYYLETRYSDFEKSLFLKKAFPF